MWTQKSNYQDVLGMKNIALTAVLTTTVFLSTAIFSLALVASSGYFNLGEVFVYVSALIGGPIIGAIAGGFGSAMADAFLGYGAYVPATLIFKGLEGFVVGYLFRLIQDEKTRSIRRWILVIITIFFMFLSIFFTTPILNGVEGSDVIEGSFVFLEQIISFEILGIVFVAISAALCIIMWYIELFQGDKGKMALSCLLAGPIIIVGYFCWQVLVLNYVVEAALFEVPFNIAQVLFGTFIAVPIVTSLNELGIINSDTPKEKTDNEN